ncbi:MAG: hypothetical protein ACFHWX_16430 [Bacteroidota bacterium]
MNFFKKIFSSDSSEPPKEPPISKFPELEDAWQHFKKEEFEQSIEKASKSLNSSKLKIKNEANKLIALSNFRLGDYGTSRIIFKELVVNSKNPDDWFNLVTSATLNNEIELGKQAFDKAIELYRKNGKKDNLSVPSMMFYYMQCLKDIKCYDLAFEQLDGLRKIYTDLKITDSTFLYLRGVPFFEHSIDASEEILINLDPQIVKDWLTQFKKSVDDDGQQYLAEFEQKLNYVS